MAQLDQWHLLFTAALTGLIWVIQLVHYPSFHFISEAEFSRAMVDHQQRISMIVVPLMLAEATLASYSAWVQRSPSSFLLLIIVALIWLTTFTLQVPIHEKLLAGKDDALIGSLVRGNWIRTGLWNLKLVLFLYFGKL